jgi:hypothetical protein
MSVSLAMPTAPAQQGELQLELASHRQHQQLYVLLANLVVILDILLESERGR